MKKTKLLIFVFILSISSLKAQLGFLISGEGGVAGSTMKSDQISLFYSTYNSTNASGGLTRPFKTTLGVATGRYFNFMVGLGGEKCKETLGFGQYLVRTPVHEARFSNGVGRDVTVEIKDASTEVGVRFDAEKFTTGFQFDVLIRNISIYSNYVYADGSKSFGNDKSLNGVYSNSRLQLGIGGNIGYRIVSNIYVVGKFDYIFQTDKKHPEYHIFTDLNYFKPAGTDTLYNINNDVHGLRFGLGIQFFLSSFDE